jgi:hypothetical protein
MIVTPMAPTAPPMTAPQSVAAPIGAAGATTSSNSATTISGLRAMTIEHLLEIKFADEI